MTEEIEYKKLKPEAKEYLSIVHLVDVIKVLAQLEFLVKEKEHLLELQKLSDDEYNQLQSLLEKYIEMLKSL